uniref:Uncharacterized protein n=1 Tax=Araucaria cunninghamii TaxID=56994 RepID=A0A0D6QY86_ARACU
MSSSISAIEPELVIAHKLQESFFTYTERDVALYALGIGACGASAVDETELKYVYHPDGQLHIQVFPTFAVLFPFSLSSNLTEIPGLHFDPSLLLHGQQYLEIYKPLPTNCHIENRSHIVGLHDKGKAAILEIESTSYNKDTGEMLCRNRMTTYLRGAGGFSKAPDLYSYSSPSSIPKITSVRIPKDAPSVIHEDNTRHAQALLYRLSGDYNPLHSDPIIANIAGFSRPILHGLCTLGYAVRAIIKCCCGGSPSLVKSVLGRFLLHVYPGETLITEMWKTETRIIYQTRVKERGKVVLAGSVVMNLLPSAL